jgi:hypothetical protein
MATATPHGDLSPPIGYSPADHGTCFAHRHLTMEEYGLWTHARQLAHESGIFYFDGRKIAERFGQTKKDAAYRVGRNLIRKGWLVVVRKPKRLKTGMFSPGQYRPLTHEEWAAKHPGTCLEIQTGAVGTCLEIQNDLSGNPERPVWKSRHNMKGLNEKGEYESETETDTHTSLDTMEGKNEGEIEPNQFPIPDHQNQNQSSENMVAAPAPPPPDENAIVSRVWGYYLAATGKDAMLNTLTSARLKLGKARLRECLVRTGGNCANAEELMKCAIDAIAKSPWHMGHDPKTNGQTYNDWERNIFRDYETMERLWNR